MDTEGRSSAISVVPMAKEHLERLAEIEAECFSAPWSFEGLYSELSNPAAVFYTAIVDGNIAGYAGMHHILDEGYIANIAVAKSYRRRGVATALIEELISYAKDNDLSFITLEVRSSNEAAIALYSSLKFSESGRRPGFYTNPPEDAILMTRNF